MIKSHFTLENLYTINHKTKKCKTVYYPSNNFISLRCFILLYK